MIAAVSLSSFVATGLALKSPDNSDEPAYFAKDLGRLLKIKQDLINDFYHYRPDRMIMYKNYNIHPVLKYFVPGVLLYLLGLYLFDNSDIEKAYQIV